MSEHTPLLKLRSVGRGRRYTPKRGLVESVLRVAYAGSWPARLWAMTPHAGRVARVEHTYAVGRGGRPPLRVAFASDLHLGPTTSPRTLDRAFELLREARPDVLVLGGDYVFLEATPAVARELGRRVRSVPAAVKVAVMGNHDLWTHHGLIEEALADAGVRVLVNDAVRLPPPHDDVAIVGIDDPWTGSPDAPKALAAAGDAAVRVVACHAPDAVPMLDGAGEALLLCGHTHGGHVALPGPRPLVIPGPCGWRWPWGLHRTGDVTLFVSRGVGGIEVPFRAYAPPDVALVQVVDAGA